MIGLWPVFFYVIILLGVFMKIIDFNFRDIDKMIIQLDDTNILKVIDLKLDVPFYGVIYIDHEKGNCQIKKCLH